MALIVGAYLLYGALKDKYQSDELGDPSQITGDKDGQTDSTDGTEDSDGTNSEEDADKYKAPDFVALDWEGNEVKLSDYFGKPIVLNFWASWCYYCKVEMPDFNVAYKSYPEVQFLMLNVADGDRETVEAAKKYIEEKGFEFPVIFDTTMEASYKYGASGLPVTFFINAEGELEAYQSGTLTPELLEKGIRLITE